MSLDDEDWKKDRTSCIEECLEVQSSIQVDNITSLVETAKHEDGQRNRSRKITALSCRQLQKYNPNNNTLSFCSRCSVWFLAHRLVDVLAILILLTACLRQTMKLVFLPQDNSALLTACLKRCKTEQHGRIKVVLFSDTLFMFGVLSNLCFISTCHNHIYLF